MSLNKEKCEYCESGVNHDPISMFCHLRDEHKQDSTDWEKDMLMKEFIRGDTDINEITFSFQVFDVAKEIRQKAFKEGMEHVQNTEQVWLDHAEERGYKKAQQDVMEQQRKKIEKVKEHAIRDENLTIAKIFEELLDPSNQ